MEEFSFHCFARGCSYQEIVKALGLNVDNGFGWREVVDYYDYEDEEGKVVKRKVRYFPKGFGWECKRIDPITKEEIWVGQEGSYKDTPYHLPEVIKAIEANRRIVISEGEKDANNITEFCAGYAQGTTLGSAIQGPNDSRLNGLDYLEEYDDIVIIPDNDGAGSKNVKLIANRLIRRGSRVKIVRVDGNGVKDISDWIAKKNFFDFEELVKSTPCSQISDDPLGYLRLNYTLVDIGGKTLALNLRALDEGRLVATSHDNFMHGYGARTIVMKEGKQERKVKVGPVWWEQQVNEVGILKLVYKPGEEQVKEDELNLWRGWGVEPSEKGSCELLKEHLLKIVCQGNQVYYKYLWDWMADMFQNPKARRGISCRLERGRGRREELHRRIALRKLLGTGYYLLDNSKILDSQFNEYMVNRLLVHLEEAFFSGNYSVKAYLKSISTSEILQINPKGLPTFTVNNYLKLLVTSNAEWMLPVDWRDRRYFVLDVAPDKANDRAYFAAIREELENGGFERLLWELLNTEITSDWSKFLLQRRRRSRLLWVNRSCYGGRTVGSSQQARRRSLRGCQLKPWSLTSTFMIVRRLPRPTYTSNS